MPNIGPLEIAIVLIIALVIFGPKRLPELGRSAGKGFREFKNTITGDDTDEEKDEDDAPPAQSEPAMVTAESVNGSAAPAPEVATVKRP